MSSTGAGHSTARPPYRRNGFCSVRTDRSPDASRRPSSTSREAATTLAGAATIVAHAFLDRRAGHRPVGAKHAAMAWHGLEQRLARGALVEVLARVGRHRLDLRGAALRASERGLANDIHIGGSIQKVSTSNPMARTRAVLLAQPSTGLAHAAPGAHDRAFCCRTMMRALAPRQTAAA